jgi:hypothetical protein
VFYDLGDKWSYYAMDTCIHREGTDMSGLCARCEDAIHAANHPSMVDGCFACKVDTIGLTYRYGREEFHGPTIRERQREQEAVCERDGVKAEPVGERWV